MLDTTTTTLTVNAGRFADAMRAVKHAICQEPARFCGVLLEHENGGLNLVATDGHRLACAKIAGDFPQFASIIIPEETVADLLKSEAAKNKFAHANLALDITSIKTKIRWAAGDEILIDFQPIQGTFPDYRRVIPQGGEYRATVNRETLLAACAGIAALNMKVGRAPGVIKLAFTKEQIAITGTRSFVAPADGEISAQCSFPAALEGDPITLGCNPAYLRDIAAAHGAKELTLKMADPGSPIRIESGEDLLSVLMPCRI